VLFDGGTEFDNSYDRGQPFEFQLGAGGVIPGWDEGVQGMKVGGRRQLVIPPQLGYGAQGSPPDIPPNSTLVFVIDLLSVE
jgi:peptidylprolyl isomerase